jgi:hypothetical protein
MAHDQKSLPSALSIAFTEAGALRRANVRRNEWHLTKPPLRAAAPAVAVTVNTKQRVQRDACSTHTRQTKPCEVCHGLAIKARGRQRAADSKIIHAAWLAVGGRAR